MYRWKAPNTYVNGTQHNRRDLASITHSPRNVKTNAWTKTGPRNKLQKFYAPSVSVERGATEPRDTCNTGLSPPSSKSCKAKTTESISPGVPVRSWPASSPSISSSAETRFTNSYSTIDANTMHVIDTV